MAFLKKVCAWNFYRFNIIVWSRQFSTWFFISHGSYRISLADILVYWFRSSIRITRRLASFEIKHHSLANNNLYPKPYTLQIHRLTSYRGENLLFVFPSEWRIPAQHHIQYHSAGPNIAFLCVVTKQHLRSHVIRSSLFLGHWFVEIVSPRYPEIYQFQGRLVRFVTKQYIIRLQVSMDYFFIMAMSHCPYNLVQVFSRLLFTKIGHLLYSVKQLTALKKPKLINLSFCLLGDNVVILIIRIELEYLDDVRMIQRF